ATHIATSFTGEHGLWTANFYRGTLSAVTSPEVVAGGLSQRLVTKFLRAEWKATLLSTEGTGLGNLAPAVDSAAVVEEIVDPRNHKTRTTRNRFGQPLTVTDLAGEVTTYGWTVDGLLKTLVEPNGRKTEYDWNANGQLIAAGVDGNPTYQASYTRPDHPDHEVVGGVTRWYTRGTRGELLRSWYGAQSDATRKGTTYEYDALYRLTRTTGPKGERHEWTYGDAGNVATARSILEDGTASTTSYTYDNAGRLYTTTNSLGQRTTFGYDSRNRVREVRDPLERVLKLDYTGEHLTQVTDRAGKVFGFAYNALGWLTAETFPGSQSRAYAYDADGLLLSKTDRRGLTVTSTYDTAHRQLTRTADNATSSYGYPDRYTFTASNAEGSLTSVLHPTLGIADSVRMTIAGVPGRLYELKNVLDPEQNRSIGTDLKFYANGVVFQTNPTRSEATPDGDGGRVTVTDPRGLATTLLHDVAGNHIQTILPNNVTQNHTFATDGRLLSTWFSGGSVNDILGSDFTYDALGRLKTRTNNLGKMKWTYGYTTAGELGSFVQTASMPPVGCDPRIRICTPTWSTVRSATYAYDNAGNRTDSGASLAPNSNRYASFAGYALEYDFEGNLTRKSKAGFDQRLTWNALGQLTSITTNGAVATFGYDAMNRRVRRTADGYSRYFLYDEDDLLLELGPDGGVWRSYTHLPGTDRPLSVREFGGPAGEAVYYYVVEPPGHVRALLDANGAIIGEYAYTPFGEPIATAKGEGIAQPLRFMARELDPGTRLYYVRNRWYDPELGRFISEDPIGLAGGINTYAYVGNDPMNGRDPSGLMQEDGTICDIMPWLNMCQGPAILLPTIYTGSGGLGGRLTPHGPPETGDEYDFRTSFYKTCGDNTLGRGFSMSLYNSAECREIRDRDIAIAAAETARREECYRQANAGSTWGQDFRHEAKWNAVWGVGGIVVGAVVGTVVCGPACGVAGGKIGAGLGAVGVFGTAAVEATVDRAGDRSKRCGSAW
ncbi:MAG TPA: RHS repeat-associated core domain-containing protein, partial [Thermoanaerobaculia bacterium]|nr:RHS repeat-associated core domain-containing protein [Thermoanaerobaculia bacterium]